MSEDLDFHEIQYRLQNNVIFRLFRKERAALMLSFFIETFKKGNRSNIKRSTLASELEAFRDFLFISSDQDHDESRFFHSG